MHDKNKKELRQVKQNKWTFEQKIDYLNSYQEILDYLQELRHRKQDAETPRTAQTFSEGIFIKPMTSKVERDAVAAVSLTEAYDKAYKRKERVYRHIMTGCSKLPYKYAEIIYRRYILAVPLASIASWAHIKTKSIKSIHDKAVEMIELQKL